MTLLWKGDTHVSTGSTLGPGEDVIVSNLKPERQIIAWQARAVILARGRRYRDAARYRLRAVELQRQIELATASVGRE